MAIEWCRLRETERGVCLCEISLSTGPAISLPVLNLLVGGSNDSSCAASTSIASLPLRLRFGVECRVILFIFAVIPERDDVDGIGKVSLFLTGDLVGERILL